jgi:hypothetical protein
MIPDVGDDALPSLPPQQPCSHASVRLGASGAALDVAVDELRKWLRRYAINAKYPTDPDLDKMCLPLLQFYYCFHEYLYGCSSIRRACPLSPFSIVCRGIFRQQVESAGYTNLVMGDDTFNQPLAPLFEKRWCVLHDRPVDDDDSSLCGTPVDLGDDDDDSEEGDEDDEDDEEESKSPPSGGKGLMLHGYGGKGLLTGPTSVSAGNADAEVGRDEAGVAAVGAAGSQEVGDAAALVYPLKSTEQEDYTRVEHPQFHRQCALFLRRLISKHFPESVVSSKTRTTTIRNMGAYLCLRMLSKQAEMYTVPLDYKVGSSWTKDLSEEQKNQCQHYLKETLGLKDGRWLSDVIHSGNAFSWKTNLRNSAPEPIFQFALNVMGLDIKRSSAPSAYMNQKKQKKQRTL